MKLQKLCSPLGISNDHNVTRAILNDTVSGKVILVLFRFSCKLSTLCSLKKDQNRTKYFLLQNYMASSVSMILAFSFSVRYHLQLNKFCACFLFQTKKNTKKERKRKLEKPRVSHKGADSMVLELVSSVTINITLDFTTCCKASLQDHLGSLRAHIESRHVRRA